MGLTLAEARDVVEDFLDDASNVRWSTSQVDVALKYALSMCLNDYISAGGDRFDEVLSTTSTTSGTVDLSSYDPVKIQGMTMTVGTRQFPITEIAYEERGLEDSVARSVVLRFVRSYVLPTTTSHALVGNGATAAKSWFAFDHWICIKAALYCSIKDADPRPELAALEKEARENVVFTTSIPKSLAFPQRPHWYSTWIGFSWKADSQKIVLSRRGGF